MGQAQDDRVVQTRQFFDQAFKGVVASSSWAPESAGTSRDQQKPRDEVVRSSTGSIEQISYSERTASWMALLIDRRTPFDYALARKHLDYLLRSENQPLGRLASDFGDLLGSLFELGAPEPPVSPHKPPPRTPFKGLEWLKGLGGKDGSSEKGRMQRADAVRADAASDCMSVGMNCMHQLLLDFLPPLKEDPRPWVAVEAVRAVLFYRAGRSLRMVVRQANVEADAELAARTDALSRLLPCDLGLEDKFWLLPSAPESALERDRFLAEQPLPYAEAISLLQLVSQASDPYQKLRIICDACACVARCVEKYHAAAQPPPASESPPAPTPAPAPAPTSSVAELDDIAPLDRIAVLSSLIEQRRQLLLLGTSPEARSAAALERLAVSRNAPNLAELDDEPAAAAPTGGDHATRKRLAAHHVASPLSRSAEGRHTLPGLPLAAHDEAAGEIEWEVRQVVAALVATIAADAAASERLAKGVAAAAASAAAAETAAVRGREAGTEADEATKAPERTEAAANGAAACAARAMSPPPRIATPTSPEPRRRYSPPVTAGESLTSPHDDSLALGAEQLLPLMTYVLVRARLPCLRSELWTIERFVDDEQALLGTLGYGLATISAATQLMIHLDPPEAGNPTTAQQPSQQEPPAGTRTPTTPRCSPGASPNANAAPSDGRPPAVALPAAVAAATTTTAAAVANAANATAAATAAAAAAVATATVSVATAATAAASTVAAAAFSNSSRATSPSATPPQSRASDDVATADSELTDARASFPHTSPVFMRVDTTAPPANNSASCAATARHHSGRAHRSPVAAESPRRHCRRAPAGGGAPPSSLWTDDEHSGGAAEWRFDLESKPPPHLHRRSSSSASANSVAAHEAAAREAAVAAAMDATCESSDFFMARRAGPHVGPISPWLPPSTLEAQLEQQTEQQQQREQGPSPARTSSHAPLQASPESRDSHGRVCVRRSSRRGSGSSRSARDPWAPFTDVESPEGVRARVARSQPAVVLDAPVVAGKVFAGAAGIRPASSIIMHGP